MKLALLREVQRARADKQPVAVVTDLGSGAQGLVYADGLAAPDLSLTAAQVDAVRTWLRTARSGTLGDSELFVRSYVPDYRLLIVGAVHIAQALAALALECGYQVTVIDPRRAFATAARFGDVELCTQWPDEAMARLAPDAQTAVVTLAHDPKIDDPALLAALNSDAFYIGALGSSRTHARRVERLTQQGLGEKLVRIHAPIGLQLGGRSHAEIALSILAQLVQVRYGA
ncbi:MAG: XdhC family protein [Halioglobus sp.]|nr:XdhC family protein [Halioglobus sp.]